MPNYTDKHKFTKPLPTELYDVEVFNSNMDKVEEALEELEETITNSSPKQTITYGMEDLTAGTSALTTGAVHLVYE